MTPPAFRLAVWSADQHSLYLIWGIYVFFIVVNTFFFRTLGNKKSFSPNTRISEVSNFRLCPVIPDANWIRSPWRPDEKAFHPGSMLSEQQRQIHSSWKWNLSEMFLPLMLKTFCVITLLLKQRQIFVFSAHVIEILLNSKSFFFNHQHVFNYLTLINYNYYYFLPQSTSGTLKRPCAPPGRNARWK